MIEKRAIEEYFGMVMSGAEVIEFQSLGSGAHGTGFSLTLKTAGDIHEFVIKELAPRNLGHDYPSDRAAVFLLAEAEYGNLPNHVKALDVLSLRPDGTLRSVGGGKDYFLIMERSAGTNYFADLRSFRTRPVLDEQDRGKISAMASYLSQIHAIKKDARNLYWRKLRDTVGHGECLMGVFDTYPDGTLGYGEMARIEKKCIDWRARLKPLHHRLSQIHGDFHPGNIRFHNKTFTLLDRSRGPYGEPADDITALTVNYLFFSIQYFDRLKGPYDEALRLFFEEYLKSTGDAELLKVCGLFFAFRGAVVANPAFYPEVTQEKRRIIFAFIRNVLEDESFDYQSAGRYLAD
jgi:aminoglycoside phosphotransferase (APT) family kinase protein